MKKLAIIHALLTFMVLLGMSSGILAKDHDIGKDPSYQIIGEDHLRDVFMEYLLHSTGGLSWLQCQPRDPFDQRGQPPFFYSGGKARQRKFSIPGSNGRDP